MTVVASTVGLVSSDLPRTLAFCRVIGLDIPADADSAPHVEVTLPGGFRILFDRESTINSFDPVWSPSPAGFDGHLEPWDAFWGNATRRCATRMAMESICSPRCRQAETPSAR